MFSSDLNHQWEQLEQSGPIPDAIYALKSIIRRSVDGTNPVRAARTTTKDGRDWQRIGCAAFHVILNRANPMYFVLEIKIGRQRAKMPHRKNEKINESMFPFDFPLPHYVLRPQISIKCSKSARPTTSKCFDTSLSKVNSLTFFF
jgi:hypothetical protein